MTVQYNTYADITSIVNTIYEDALIVAAENSIMPALAKNFTDQDGMAPRKNFKYNTTTVNQIGETDDLTSQAFTPTVDQTLTPYEYGQQVFLSDQRLASDPNQVQSDAELEFGTRMGEKVDTLLCSSFSSFTAGTSGTANGDLTWAYFLGAIAKLVAAHAPRPYVAVISPFQWHCLGSAIAPGVTVTNAPALQNDFVANYFVANVGGVDILTDSNVSGHNTGTCYGGVFSRNLAVGLDWRRPYRLEPERKPSRRGWELNMTAIYAYGVWRPQYGVTIMTAGTAPA